MGSPKHAHNRRRRTRKGPEPACVQTPNDSGRYMQGRKDELTSWRGTVKSTWQNPPVRRKGGRAGLPKKGWLKSLWLKTFEQHIAFACVEVFVCSVLSVTLLDAPWMALLRLPRIGLALSRLVSLGLRRVRRGHHCSRPL